MSSPLEIGLRSSLKRTACLRRRVLFFETKPKIVHRYPSFHGLTHQPRTISAVASAWVKARTGSLFGHRQRDIPASALRARSCRCAVTRRIAALAGTGSRYWFRVGLFLRTISGCESIASASVSARTDLRFIRAQREAKAFVLRAYCFRCAFRRCGGVLARGGSL